MLAVPVMAGVTVEPNYGGFGRGKIITVRYSVTATDVNIPRAFALDVNMSPANGTALAPSGFNSNFYVAPGTFTYDPCTGATNWGNPIVGATTTGFTTEMGSLWDPCDGNHPTQPPSSGTLFSFVVDKNSTITLAQNAVRGGVVMEDTSKTFPAGYVTLVGCTMTVAQPQVAVPNVANVLESISMNPTNAMTMITNAGLVNGARTLSAHATIAAGKVISTTPAIGTMVDVGSTVDRLVSTGPATCATCVGDLVTDSSKKVSDMSSLRAKLVNSFARTGLYQADKGSQVTGDQWHICGDMVADNALKVSDLASLRAQLVAGFNAGGLYQAPFVPNVVNMTQAAATTAITNAKLVLGNVTTANHPTIVAGNVISSNPAYPTYRNCGTTVDIVVSLGP
jgi:hypothetical protein